MIQSPHMKKVIVSLSSNSNAMRESIIGVLRFVNSGHDWNLTIIPDPIGVTKEGLTPEAVSAAVKAGIDGVITGVDRDTSGFRALIRSGIPCSLVNHPANWRPNPGCRVALLHNDDVGIGRLGARYLHGKGTFQSYAFIPSPEKCFWSTFRRRGFELELAKHALQPFAFSHKRNVLDEWISALPKPAAIMAVSDYYAMNVLESCRRLNFNVPTQVAILGVDNDELYCNTSKPTLSSIHPDHMELGHRAAVELNRLMTGKLSTKVSFIPPIRIIERGSTRTIPPSGHLIREGLRFIQNHYNEGITARDVAEHLGVSESLLRLRFRTTHGKSVRDILLDTRLRAVQRMLAHTRKPMSRIAKETGFSSACRLSHFVTERLGLSPGEWRANHQS